MDKRWFDGDVYLTTRLRNHTLALSFLLHAMLLGGSSIVLVPSFQPEKKPSMYVPSYTYSEPPAQSSPALTQEKAEQKQPVEEKKVVDPKEVPVSNAVQIKRASQARTNSSTKVTEAIHLVGDKDTVPKPLIILLGKAISSKLVYPKIAIDFRLRGIAYIGFTLHPDGTITNVQVVQSSRAGVLDNQAAAAISAMSPVKGVSQYVDKAKPMVVGIIFG